MQIIGGALRVKGTALYYLFQLDYRVQENAERGTEVKGNKPIEAFDLDLDPEIFYYIICKYTCYTT